MKKDIFKLFKKGWGYARCVRKTRTDRADEKYKCLLIVATNNRSGMTLAPSKPEINAKQQFAVFLLLRSFSRSRSVIPSFFRVLLDRSGRYYTYGSDFRSRIFFAYFFIDDVFIGYYYKNRFILA